MQRNSIAVLLVVALTAGDVVVQTSEPSAQRRDLSTATDAGSPDTRALWRDPGEVEQLNLANGPGGPEGAPQPPFRFVQEHLSGSTAKIRVTEARGVAWIVKFGGEASPQTFAARLVSAVGYFAIPTYYVASGTVQELGPLKRAKPYVTSEGRFKNASFEKYLDSSVNWLADARSWSWSANPFVGTPELNGLKILVMLLSDWDNKDARDIKRGSNTAILVYSGGDTRYLVVDWGGSMGKWGGYLQRDKWQCGDYKRETHDFVRGVRGNAIRWGYSGQHTKDFTEDVRANDVRWLLKYLGRINDAQLRGGLLSSGASRAGADCFVKAIRNRISQLQSITSRVNSEDLAPPHRAACPEPPWVRTATPRPRFRKREHGCLELRMRVRVALYNRGVLRRSRRDQCGARVAFTMGAPGAAAG